MVSFCLASPMWYIKSKWYIICLLILCLIEDDDFALDWDMLSMHYNPALHLEITVWFYWWIFYTTNNSFFIVKPYITNHIQNHFINHFKMEFWIRNTQIILYFLFHSKLKIVLLYKWSNNFIFLFITLFITLK